MPLEILLFFVALYPVVTAAVWIAGGLVYWLTDETAPTPVPRDELPGVTVLIPAFNEEAVIGVGVAAALASDYPHLEVIVLDDGSTDNTAQAAKQAAKGDARLRVNRDPVNRGKAEQLNAGFRMARNDLVVTVDADSHLLPHAVKLMVARIRTSPMLVAVAGAPHVTNRTRLICALQVLEAASIIGLIRRTQSVTGRVGTVAGVLGMFRRDKVLALGGYDGRMATEDIDLTWRLLLAGGQTAYEPNALVGMQVPSTLRALWAQRTRWARGQGEVLHEHLRTVGRWRNRRMWLLSVEAVASLLWVVALSLSLVLAVLNVVFAHSLGNFGFGLAWGVAISVVATVQMVVAVSLNWPYDRRVPRALLLGAIYPMLYWLISGAAALRTEVGAAFTGPRGHRVVWDIPREAEAPLPEADA